MHPYGSKKKTNYDTEPVIKSARAVEVRWTNKIVEEMLEAELESDFEAAMVFDEDLEELEHPGIVALVWLDWEEEVSTQRFTCRVCGLTWGDFWYHAGQDCCPQCVDDV